MTRTLLALSALTLACATEADTQQLPVDQAAVPTLVHTPVNVEPGATAQFVVDGAGYGERVYILFSTAGLGAGPCPPVIGGQCLDIAGPIRVLGTAIADVSGRAIIEVDVPATAPLGATISTQAAVIRGAGGVDSLLSEARTTVAEITNENIGWSFTGLPQLGPDFVYENWLVTDGVAATAGRFTVGPTGIPSSTTFPVTPDQVARAEAFIVTIEPAFMDDPAPAPTHILAGDLVDGVADLSIAHEGALGHSFEMASGSYFLETPSTANIADDFAQGIWFLDPAVGEPSLDLPMAPMGWEYEGWVVVGGMPLSTGRFVDPAAPDFDGGGAGAGPDATPPFPGQDFILPPYDLTGATVVISIEPQPDDSPAPFALKPLVDMTVEDFGPGVLQELTNQAAATNPIGIAWFE